MKEASWTNGGWRDPVVSGEEDAALRVIQNALTERERTIKWCVIYTS